MNPFKIYPSEKKTHVDRISGQKVTKLTHFFGNSSHPYFTDNGWYDNNSRMLFTSDRYNSRNLHSIHINSGEIHQLTDFPEGDGVKAAFTKDVNKPRNETYYTFNGCVYALRLTDLSVKPIYKVPPGFSFGGARPTADGKYVIGGLTEDYSSKVKSNLDAAHNMHEIFNVKPDCRIIRIDLDTNRSEEIWQENNWVGHINPSPTQHNLLTFCHEGPWNLVDHRIWTLDIADGKTFKLRERKIENEMVGHEYWLQDGLHIGYQVHRHLPDLSMESFFGFVKYDNTGEFEAPCIAMPSPDHIFSNGFDFVVSDSGKHIKGYKFNGKSFDGPRIICMHDGCFDCGSHHPHPRLTSDGKKIIFNSNVSGYCNIYMVDVPEDFESLPLVCNKQ